MSEQARPAVLVTGGAQRIGAAIARGFGEAGWHVVIHHHSSANAADDLAAALPSAETVQCDLTDSEAAVAMIHDLSARLTDWRALINNASVFQSDEAGALNPEIWSQAMRINAEAPIRMSAAFIAHASAHKGRRVVTVTDQKIANPNPDFFSYSISKFAVSASIRLMAMKLRQDGAEQDRIYGIAPGAILPSHDQNEDEAEISHRMNLLERRTAPEEIAQAALFLADGCLQSGETIFVDSGQHLMPQSRDVIYLARG